MKIAIHYTVECILWALFIPLWLLVATVLVSTILHPSTALSFAFLSLGIFIGMRANLFNVVKI